MRTLEAAILRELRRTTGIKKLRQKDIVGWSTGEVPQHAGERYAHLQDLGVHVAYRVPEKKKKPKGDDAQKEK